MTLPTQLPSLEQLKEATQTTTEMKTIASRLRILYPLIDQLLPYYSHEKIRETLEAGGLNIKQAGFKTALYRAKNAVQK